MTEASRSNSYRRFDTPVDLVRYAVDRIACLASEAIHERGRFLVALSGGETPRPLYHELAASPKLDWERIDVFWVDERCVPRTDPRSNVRMVSETLLDRVSIPKERVHPIDGALLPADAASGYEREVRAVLGSSPLDLVLLGMGADGHTASLFPNHPALQEAKRWILPVRTPAQPSWRVTMTLPLLNAANHVVFLVTGASKAAAIRRLADGAPLPAAQAQPANGDLEVLIDSEAAAGLEP